MKQGCGGGLVAIGVRALHEGPEDVVGDEAAEWIGTAVLFVA